MKKLITMVFICFLLFTVLSSARIIEVANAGTTDKLKAVIAAKNAGAASSCPSYYASAVLSWDGDHDSGNMVACTSDTTEVTFTSVSAEITTDGDGGSNALKVDDDANYMWYRQTTQQYFNDAASQTICVKIKHVDDPDGSYDGTFINIVKFEEPVETNDAWYLYYYQTTPALATEWKTESGDDSASGVAVTWNIWTVIAASNDVADTDYLNINSGTEATWDNGWDPDADAISLMTENPTDLKFGNYSGDDPGDTEYYLIDEWAIFNGYSVDCSLYMTDGL